MPDRVTRWITAARIFAPVELSLSFLGSSLGKLDVDLISKDATLSQRARKLEGGGTITQFGEELTLSYLWVLGAYEFVRVLSQRAREGELFFKIRFPGVDIVKHKFVRLRIPLAKLEPAKHHGKTDFRFPFPMFDHELESTGWLVAPGVRILRRELADELLALLEEAL